MSQKPFCRSFFLLLSFSALSFLVGCLFMSAFAQAQDRQMMPSTSVVPFYAQPVVALQSWDFFSDDSFQKYLSEKTPFTTIMYEPVQVLLQ
jgi:hypothetical protein